MTLKHLKIFVVVYQHMNVTKVAKESYIWRNRQLQD